MVTHFDSTLSLFGHPNVGMNVCQWQPTLPTNHKRLYNRINRFNLLHQHQLHLLIHIYPCYRLKLLYLNHLRKVLPPNALKYWALKLQLLQLVYNITLYSELFIHELDYHIMGCRSHKNVIPILN